VLLSASLLIGAPEVEAALVTVDPTPVEPLVLDDDPVVPGGSSGSAPTNSVHPAQSAHTANPTITNRTSFTLPEEHKGKH
jgi:hypothetical protein